MGPGRRLVAGHDQIVAEFFDIGQSRTLAWAQRPRAAALVAELADPDRGWDAIVIGEYERAFYASQYTSMAPLFEHYGIQLWTPEVDGRIGLRCRDHEQTMLALGFQSKAGDHSHADPGPDRDGHPEQRAGPLPRRAAAEGVPARGCGSAPEQAHAAWGRRTHRLEPDPVTGPVVQWMFAQRLAGHSTARITRALNDASVPCPSAANPSAIRTAPGQRGR